MPMKNSNDTIENQTHDFPVCSATGATTCPQNYTMLKQMFIANKATYILPSLQDAERIRNASRFSFRKPSRHDQGPTQPPMLRETEFFPGIKRPGREDEHSPPSSEEVWNQLSYISSNLYAFKASAGTNLLLLLPYILLILQDNEVYMVRYNRQSGLYSIRLMGC